MTVRSLLKLILMLFFVKQGICEEYACGFTEGLTDCKDFENKNMDGSNMQLGKAKVEGEDVMYLEGSIEVLYEVYDGCLFELDIAKETEVGAEPMWSCTMNICESIKDKDAPWSAAMKALGINGCPIETGKYHCSNLSIDMSSLKDKMNHNFEGAYEVQMKICDDKMNTLSCHNMGVAILKM